MDTKVERTEGGQADGGLDTAARQPFPAWLTVALRTWPEVLVALGSVGMGAANFVAPERRALPFAASAGVFVTGSVAVARRKPRRAELLLRVRELSDEVERLHAGYFEQLDDYLSTLLDYRLGFSDEHRVSLYRYSPSGELLHRVGRHSRNPMYKQAGRVVYPGWQGCIGSALAQGRATLRDAPDPDTDLGAYLSMMQADWQVPPEVVRGFAMPSRHLSAHALLDSKGKDRIGVVAFEKVGAAPMDFDAIDRLMRSDEPVKLTQFLEAARSPDLSLAEGSGY